jgi:hypothetical protein
MRICRERTNWRKVGSNDLFVRAADWGVGEDELRKGRGNRGGMIASAGRRVNKNPEAEHFRVLGPGSSRHTGQTCQDKSVAEAHPCPRFRDGVSDVSVGFRWLGGMPAGGRHWHSAVVTANLRTDELC